MKIDSPRGGIGRMTEEFVNSLLKLYPMFDKVTGPYLRKDGRKHICLNNSKLPKGSINKTKTLSWPKALVEVREGRLLLNNETVDHDDENFTNDDLNNLKILTRLENILKNHKTNPRKWFIGNCPVCDMEFSRPLNIVLHNKKLGKSGPYCSKKCAGLVNATNHW